ncbi:MAG: hypothetical protein WC767_00975 [Candidatus Paceibacterota bacterium]|jgi:hypothetical protein
MNVSSRVQFKEIAVEFLLDVLTFIICIAAVLLFAFLHPKEAYRSVAGPISDGISQLKRRFNEDFREKLKDEEDPKLFTRVFWTAIVLIILAVVVACLRAEAVTIVLSEVFG